MAVATPVRVRKVVTTHVDVRYTLEEYRLIKQILGVTAADTKLAPSKWPTCQSLWSSMEHL